MKTLSINTSLWLENRKFANQRQMQEHNTRAKVIFFALVAVEIALVSLALEVLK